MSEPIAAVTLAGGDDPQAPRDAAVVVVTTLRATLVQAVRSIYAQANAGRIQILIGIDKREGDPGLLQSLAAECPSHVALTVVDPGYSTARANGGIHASRYGGALRSALSLLANARRLAYLDDDNWYAPDHLARLAAALEGAGWAWTQRTFVDAANDEPIAVDVWDSVGPDAGTFAKALGGMVDSNCLMIDSRRALDLLWRWSQGAAADDAWDDRFVWEGLRELEPGRGTGHPTVFYRIDRTRHAALSARIAGPPPAPPPARRRDLAAVMRAIHPTSPYEGRARAPSEPPPVHDGYRRLLESIGARQILDMGAGDGAATVALAHAALDLERNPLVVGVDSWRPGTDLGLRSLGAKPYAATYDAFLTRVLASGCAGIVLPLAVAPMDAARGLRGLGVTVDAARVALEPGLAYETRLHDALRLCWPLVRPGGLLIVEECKPRLARVRPGWVAFAEPRALEVRLAGSPRARVIGLVKPRVESDRNRA